MIYLKGFTAIISWWPQTWCVVYCLIVHSVHWWNSMKCGWRMPQKLRISKIICICMTIHRLVSLLCCVFLSQLWQAVFVCPPVYGFLKTKTALCWAQPDHWLPWWRHSNWDWWRVGKAWHRLNQKNFIYLVLLSYSYYCQTTRYPLHYDRPRDSSKYDGNYSDSKL